LQQQFENTGEIIMKTICGVLALATASVAMANKAPSIPKDEVTKYVVENLDVTTLPSGLRPKRDHEKKTFRDYGFVVSSLEESKAIVAAPAGTRVNLTILQQKSTSLYVCVEGSASNAPGDQLQRVFLIKVKGASKLLRGRESWREFDGCPVIGGTDHDSTADSYGGD
jgi:hypothetical protein